MVWCHSGLDNFANFSARLKQGMQLPLPGRAAQLLMAPQPRRHDPEPGVRPRPAAVLLPLYAQEHQIHTILIKRKPELQHHGGEISFPGGITEQEDADAVQTALREAQEEIGLAPETVEILGLLTPLYVPPSQNLVQPVVGWLNTPPSLNPNPSEVALIFQPSLQHFTRATTVSWHSEVRQGQTYIIPAYRLGEEYVWGATAMILSELLSLLCDLEYTYPE